MLNSGARRRGWHRRRPARSHRRGSGRTHRGNSCSSTGPPPQHAHLRRQVGHDIGQELPGGRCAGGRGKEPQSRRADRPPGGTPGGRGRSAAAGPRRTPPPPGGPHGEDREGFDPRATCHGLTGWEGGKEMAMDTVASKFQQRWTIFSATKRMLSPPPHPPSDSRFWVGGGITTLWCH